MSDSIADIVKSHLDTFSSTFGASITRTIDHLVQQQERQIQNQEAIAKENASQDKRIERLELLVEQLIKREEESLKRQERQSHEFRQEVKKVLGVQNKVALTMSNIDHDRRRQNEDIDAVNYKVERWQSECTSKYNDLERDHKDLKDKVNKIYWTAAGASAFAVLVGWVIKESLRAFKILS